MKEVKSLLKLYAITPSHVGSGDTIGTVDLPIQREKHTNYPIINASSVKGAFREHYRKFKGNNKKDINIIFGTDEQDIKDDKSKDNNSPSLVSFSDSRIFAFPMRSSESPFVWVTCPYIINRFIKDLSLIGIKKNNINNVNARSDEAVVLMGNINSENVILEEAVVQIKNNKNDNKIINYEILNNLKELIRDYFVEANKLLLVSDEMFSYCVTCTDIQTNIKIDVETGTAKDGALRYQEFLPSETLLYNIVWFGNDNTNSIQESMVKDSIKDAVKDFIQIGGDETLGKGIFKISWFEKNNNN